MATQRPTTHTLDEGRITFGEAPDTTSKDPVCRMNVDSSDPATNRLAREGNTYYFCSEECRDNFVSDPGKFVNH